MPADQSYSPGERAEWFLMWMRGMEPAQIARWCKVSRRVVETEMVGRVRARAELRGLRWKVHDRPRLPSRQERRRQLDRSTGMKRDAT